MSPSNEIKCWSCNETYSERHNPIHGDPWTCHYCGANPDENPEFQAELAKLKDKDKQEVKSKKIGSLTVREIGADIYYDTGLTWLTMTGYKGQAVRIIGLSNMREFHLWLGAFLWTKEVIDP